MVVKELLGKVNEYIVNPIIMLAFAVAMVVFFWGLFQFIATETSDAKRDEGKKKILYGLLGIFIMLTVKGIIKLVLTTFGISNAGTHYIGL